jgi:hypothetical protein
MWRRVSRGADPAGGKPERESFDYELRAGPSHHPANSGGVPLSGSPAWPALHPAFVLVGPADDLFSPTLNERAGLSSPRARGRERRTKQSLSVRPPGSPSRTRLPRPGSGSPRRATPEGAARPEAIDEKSQRPRDAPAIASSMCFVARGGKGRSPS